MAEISFIDLKKQFRLHEEPITKAIAEVLSSGQYIMGPQVKKLEHVLAEYVEVKHAIGVSSGTDALMLSLMSWGIGPGDGVITSPFTFIATAEVISLLGATPIFVDIDPLTFNMSPDRLKETLSLKLWPVGVTPKAVIPVSLYGQVAEMDEISEIAHRYGLKVLEDGCQSFGAEYKCNKSCSLGDAGVTSFFPSKPLGCYGDGGMIFTNDDRLAEDCRSLRAHGQKKRYVHEQIGVNARLDTLQAAVLLAKWPFFGDELKKRTEVAQRYSESLSDDLVVPFIRRDSTSVFAQYTVRIKYNGRPGRREEVASLLKEKGIPTAIHYPVPLHLQKAFSALRYGEGNFPEAEKASLEVLSLPMHPWISVEEQEYIIKYLKEAVIKK